MSTYLSFYLCTLVVVVGPSIVVCEIAVYLNNIKPGHHVKYYNVTGTIIIVSLKIYNLHNPIRNARRMNRPAYVMMMMIALFRIGSTPSPITNWTCRTIQFGCELYYCAQLFIVIWGNKEDRFFIANPTTYTYEEWFAILLQLEQHNAAKNTFNRIYVGT